MKNNEAIGWILALIIVIIGFFLSISNLGSITILGVIILCGGIIFLLALAIKKIISYYSSGCPSP